MKVNLLVLGLAFASGTAFAQSAPGSGAEVTTPFKGANVILIHTTDSTSAALKKLARALIVAGIEPEKVEPEIGYLSTKAKPVGQLSPATFEYKAVATPEPGGTLLSITGTYTVKMNMVNSMTNSMYWVKGNLLQAKQCFSTIQPIAEAYPGGKVGYLKKP
jgi:hypothetical protein